MSTRSKNRDLLQRNGIWHFNKRLPDGSGHLRRSLKTKDVEEARQKRDQLLEDWSKVAQKVQKHKQVLDLRKQYLSSFDEGEQEYLRDLIIDESEELATRLGVWELTKSNTHYEDLPDKAKEPIKFYRTAVGQLTPFAQLTDPWLRSITNSKTRYGYDRGLKLLSKHFAAAEEVTWEKARAFIRFIQEKENVSNSTIRKWVSAYRSFWDYYDKDTSVWRNHKIPRTRVLPKRAWTRNEIQRIFDELETQNHWLSHVVKIAAYTGARRGAICSLEYRPKDKTILFKAQKSEAKDRIIPAHPEILESLDYWAANQRSEGSVTNRFTEFKKSLEYGQETDFHSFRRTFCTELENLGCPEAVTADIVGHKKQTITYGLYSGGSSIELMRSWIEKLSYFD